MGSGSRPSRREGHALIAMPSARRKDRLNSSCLPGLWKAGSAFLGWRHRMEIQEAQHKPRPHLCRPAMPDFGSGLHTLVTATAWDSAPQTQPRLGVGSGPGARGDGAAPDSSLPPPSPAGPSGVPARPRRPAEGSGSAGPAVGNKATARRRSPCIWPQAGLPHLG